MHPLPECIDLMLHMVIKNSFSVFIIGNYSPMMQKETKMTEATLGPNTLSVRYPPKTDMKRLDQDGNE